MVWFSSKKPSPGDVLQKQVFLKIPQNSEESTSVGVCF